jgi:hypothetical protein
VINNSGTLSQIRWATKPKIHAETVTAWKIQQAATKEEIYTETGEAHPE